MLFLFLVTLVQGQILTENQILVDIEDSISRMMEATVKGRSDANRKSVEKIMLRVAGTGMIALSRNEIFADSQTIFQNDDLEEEISEDDADARSSYVPTVGLDEKLFTVPSSFFLQIIGRALQQGGFVSGEILKLKTRVPPCNIDSWRSAYRQYKASYHPSVGSALPSGSLKYRLKQFLRRVKTDLSCLDGDLADQLDSLKIVVSDEIDRSSRGYLTVRDDDLNEALLAAYDAIDTVIAERRRDWNTVLKLRLATLLAKLGGLTLVTWGRNIGDWPSDVDLLNDVSTSFYVGISGRAVYSTLWLLDEFRDIYEYEKPNCGSYDLYHVITKPEFSPLWSGASLGGVEKELLLVRFSSQLKESVSCLTKVPGQFYNLDILGTKKAAKALEDRLEDIIDSVKS